MVPDITLLPVTCPSNELLLLTFLCKDAQHIFLAKEEIARTFTICQGHALPDCSLLDTKEGNNGANKNISLRHLLLLLLSREYRQQRACDHPVHGKAREGLKHCRRLSRVFHGENVMLNDDTVWFSFSLLRSRSVRFCSRFREEGIATPRISPAFRTTH